MEPGPVLCTKCEPFCKYILTDVLTWQCNFDHEISVLTNPAATNGCYLMTIFNGKETQGGHIPAKIKFPVLDNFSLCYIYAGCQVGGHVQKGGKEDIFARKGGQKEDIFY